MADDLFGSLKAFQINWMKINIIIKKPLYTDIVLLYPNSEKLLKKYVFKDISSQTVDVGTWICLHPNIIFKTLVLIFGIRLNLSLKLKDVPKQFIKDCYEKHLQAYIEVINPKFVITFIDDSGVFHRLNKDYKKDAEFIAIQNGMRPKSHFKYMLSKKTNSDSITRIQNFFCHGKADEIMFNNEGSQIDNFYPVGSLVGGIYWTEILSNKPKENKYDICLVSCWVDENRPDLKGAAKEIWEVDKRGNKVLDNNLKRLIDEKGYSVVIAMKYDNSEKEYEYFYNKFGDSVYYQRSHREKFSTYKAIDKSHLVITMYSTCAAEAIGIGKKGLFCNGSEDSSIGIPSADFCYFEGKDYCKFAKRVEKIFEMKQEDYKKRMSESLKNLMNYDYSNMPHNFMYKFLKDRL